MFSPATLALFDHLLNGVTVSAGASDFEVVALQVITARKELSAALVEVAGPAPRLDVATATAQEPERPG